MQRYDLPAAVATQYTTVIRYKVPEGRWARISSYGVSVLDDTYTFDDSILWNIQVNGINVEYLSNWGDQRGTVQQPRETFILLKEGWTIEFQVKRAVAALAATPMVLALNGWAWRLRRNYDSTKASIAAT